MQTVSSWTWTRVAVSMSHDNHYTTPHLILLDKKKTGVSYPKLCLIVEPIFLRLSLAFRYSIGDSCIDENWWKVMFWGSRRSALAFSFHFAYIYSPRFKKKKKKKKKKLNRCQLRSTKFDWHVATSEVSFPVGWGYRIHRLLLCRGERFLQRVSWIWH